MRGHFLFCLGLTLAAQTGALQAQVAQDPSAPLCAYAGDGTVVRWPGSAPAAERWAPAGSDPDVEQGFPVQAFHGPGSYHTGPAIHTIVGNIDADRELEIVRTALATGPLYAWNHNGSLAAGWPVSGVGGAGYLALGELSSASPGEEVFAGHWGTPGRLAAWTGGGVALPGWPRNSANFVGTPAALADVTGDGLAEAFIEEEDFRLHAYSANGSALAGWPVHAPLGSQERHTPAIADIDGNGDLEILTVTGWSSGGTYLLAYHHDGSVVAGFPVVVPSAYVDTYPVVGDVDGDGASEIVVVTANPSDPLQAAARVFSSTGATERVIGASSGLPYGSAPALADLDGDGTLDIVVQTDAGLYAWRGDGTALPGWPVTWTGRWMGSSAPVVGDVTGDGRPDVVITTQLAGSSVSGDVRVFSARGARHPRFPKALDIGPGAVPALADIDRDGRNEIVVSGQFWNGVSGDYDMVWAYDLGGGPHGPVLWGQFMANAAHTGTAGLIPNGLVVDGAGNGVLEAAETVVVAPAWRNWATRDLTFDARATTFSGPPGAAYAILDDTASYGTVPDGESASCTATGDCYSFRITVTANRPAPHWDAVFEESLAGGLRTTHRGLHVGDSFGDVPRASGFYRFVETLLHRGVTGGCGGTSYCPANPATREQMAVFVLVAREGGDYAPPGCAAGSEMFADVPASSPFCRWIEELARRQVVAGCGGGNYCPTMPVSRDQMAVFVLRTLDPALDPPACTTPMFGDVPASSPFCRWIEELARRQIVAGCGGGNYCPANPVTREQMSVFISATFGLTLYGP